MKRTALLLSTVVLSGLLATTPSYAAAPSAPALKTAVAQVKASPAKRSGACPTTVGFSAVVAAKGKGIIRYRWVRGDGGKSVVKSLRVNGSRKVVVRDRQTFDRDTTGWQAVEILGKKGLSGKARFSVACDGPAQVWDVSHPLPAQPGRPLESAADVDVSPAAYNGVCPATVRFTATIQVSRTPATVDYRWIDSITGEGRPESLYFAAGGPRLRQVTLPMSVGSSTRGWKAVRILTPGGHDSGRADYAVTCKSGPAPTPTSTPTSTPSSTPSSTPTSTPTQPPVTPGRQIVELTPGDYAGTCVEPVAYRATGRVTLPAGAAQQVTYWWLVDGAAWQKQVLDFPASAQARSQDVSASWTLGAAGGGAHKVGLMVEGGPSQPDERSYTFTCDEGPNDANVTFRYVLVPLYAGDCDRSFSMRVDGLFTTDRETEVRYRLVADGQPGPVRSQVLKPGVVQTIGDFWNKSAQSSGNGTVRLEVLNHNKPFTQQTYSWTCVPKDPTPGAVRIGGLTSVAYHGDCDAAPYPTAWATLQAAPNTEISYRWVIDGKPDETRTHKAESSGFLNIQAFHWTRSSKTSGTVAIEVLNHNKPTKQAAYPVNCI
ncbi:hypothetical protein GCM10009525_76240 [Streptosporangium amethystogenes subsp. fukuiense]